MTWGMTAMETEFLSGVINMSEIRFRVIGSQLSECAKNH